MTLPRARRAGDVAAALALLVALLMTPRSGEARPDAAEVITVYAAASLADILPRVVATRDADAAPVRFSFDASSRLARQIEAGAPADLLVSADAAWLDYLAQRHLVDAATRIDLAGNRLVVVVPADSAFAPQRASDLAAAPAGRIALAGELVPAGRYARAALAAAGVWPRLAARVVNGDNVRAALAWVAKGEVSAGVVYATDARSEPRVRVAFAFPTTDHPPIVYPAAVVAASRRAGEARRLLDFLRRPAAQALFVAAGFTAPDANRR